LLPVGTAGSGTEEKRETRNERGFVRKKERI
jgi:hypothetical protein